MTQTPQQEIKATDFTPDERRLMRLLAMLPAPHRHLADETAIAEARKFWNAMSEHLGTVREPSGSISVPASHAGACMETAVSAIRQAAQDQTGASESPLPGFNLRIQVARLARYTFTIFGELNDHQRAVLGEALGSSSRRASKGFIDQWLWQLHETAMSILIDNSPIEWDSGSEIAYLDKVWGHPDSELGEFFPHNVEGFGTKELAAKAQPIVKATDNRFEVWQENVGMVVLRLRTYPNRPCFDEEDFKSGLVEKQARRVLDVLKAAEVHTSKEALKVLLDRRSIKLM